MVYVLDEDGARARWCSAPRSDMRAIEGVDLVAHLRGGEAVVTSARGELRFAAGGDLEDDRGERWSVEGEPATLDLELRDGRIVPSGLPGRRSGACGRRSGARTAGDVLASAAPGYEFVDWGGADHVGRRQPRVAAPRRLARACC